LVAAPATLPAQAGIDGLWSVTINMPDGPVTVDAVFQQKGEAVVGQIDSPVGMVDFSGSFVDNALSVTFTMDVRGRSVDVEMTGALEGGTLSGVMSRSDVGEVEWTAKKKTS
jgi:hypothetical protein